MGELLKQCGLPPSSRVRAVITGDIPGEHVAGLLGGAALREVRARSLVETDQPGFALLGTTILRRTDVVVARRRFASAALNARSIHLQAWTIASLPFCPSTFEYLKDGCQRCGTIQRWRPTMNVARCDRCGSRLDWQPGETVAHGLVGGLADFAHHAGIAARGDGNRVDPLPEPIRSLGGELLYEAVNELATLLDGCPRAGCHVAPPSHGSVPGRMPLHEHGTWREAGRSPSSISSRAWRSEGRGAGTSSASSTAASGRPPIRR